MALLHTPAANPEFKAVDFALKNIDGKTLSLADVRGPNGTVTDGIVQLTLLEPLVVDARQDWLPIESVTVSVGLGMAEPPSESLSLAPSSTSVAVSVAPEAPARITVGPVSAMSRSLRTLVASVSAGPPCIR